MPLHWRDNLDKYIEALAYNPEAHAYDNVRYTSSAQFKRRSHQLNNESLNGETPSTEKS